MLHILLLILKIIGIILAIILGILLVIVCIILFVPIRYEISAKCDGTIDSLKAKVNATWLLHLVRTDVFLKGKKLKWQVKLAGFKKTNQKKQTDDMETDRKEEEKNETQENQFQKAEETIGEDEVCDENLEVIEEKCEENSEEDHEEHSDTDKTTSEKSKKESVSDKIKKYIEKIKSSIQNICNKVKELLKKKEKITDFLTEESHINAFKKVKKEVSVLLKRLKPRKTNIRLRFGFEDPCITGQVLGGLSILYPFLGDTTEIIPDFENHILEGNVYLKGRIRLCYFASLALKLLLCKDVRISYKDIRNFKL